MNIFTFFLAYWEVGYSETWPSACTRAGNAPHPEKASGSDPSEASQNQDRLLLQQGPRDEDEDDSADDLEVGQAQDGGGDQLQVKGWLLPVFLIRMQ